MYSSAEPGAFTISSSESYIYMVIGWRLYAGVNDYWFNRAYWFHWLHFQQCWQIRLRSGLTAWYARFWLRLHRTKPDMTTSWSRSALRPLRYSGDNVEILHKLSKCCQWRCRSIIIRLWLSARQKTQFECAGLLVSFTEVVGCILPSWLSQFV